MYKKEEKGVGIMLEATINKKVIEEVKSVINSDGFTHYLLSNTTMFEAAAFILQSLFNAVDDVEKELEDTEEN